MTVRNGLRAALALALSAALLAPANASASSACPGDELVPTIDTATQATLELICDIDTVRVRNGLPMLRWNWTLWWMAQRMASDLAGSSTFSHVAPDGKDLYDRAEPVGYLNENSDGLLVENLGWGRGAESSPLAVVLGWMASDAHRRNILDPEIEDFGIGIAEGAPTPGGDKGLFFVVDFGRQGKLVAEFVTNKPRRASCSRTRSRKRGRATGKRSPRRQRCARPHTKRVPG